MTAEERDRIRAHAARGVRLCTGSECGVECRTSHAVIAYVPPGDVTPPAGYAIRRYASGLIAIDDGLVMEMTIGVRQADAERLAWALLAAVHAARTATTTTPATSAAEGSNP